MVMPLSAVLFLRGDTAETIKGLNLFEGMHQKTSAFHFQHWMMISVRFISIVLVCLFNNIKVKAEVLNIMIVSKQC